MIAVNGIDGVITLRFDVDSGDFVDPDVTLTYDTTI